MSTLLDRFTKEEFELLYNSMSQKQLHYKTGISVNTLMDRVDKLGLERKPKGRPVENISFKEEQENQKQVEVLLKKYEKWKKEKAQLKAEAKKNAQVEKED